MSQTSVDPEAFRAFEVAGWEAKADPYHAFFRDITSRVIDPLLDAAHVCAGSRVLDVGTGPGYVAAAAARRGARVVGIDVAEQMVTLAGSLFPDITFERADAEHLPFPDGSFDAVVSNFMLPHLPSPENAVCAVGRVVASDGRIALSTWDSPEESALLGAFVRALGKVGASPPQTLPSGPDVFRYADDDAFTLLLSSAGFKDVRIERVAFTHGFASIDDVWDGVLAGGVRISAMVLGQPADIRRAVREHYDGMMDAYVVGDRVELPISVKVGSGRKA
ncbi:MAG: class I SAM-dependent methyltransferase [Chloroflexota bacterium]